MECGVRLLAMGIIYEDHREDIANRHLVVVLVRMTNSLIVRPKTRLEIYFNRFFNLIDVVGPKYCLPG